MMPRSLFVAVALLTSAWLTAEPAVGQMIRAGTPAPELAGERWINSASLTTPGLRGKVVLVEFWTFG